MKYLFLIAFLILLSCQNQNARPMHREKTRIDSLFTDKQVEYFLYGYTPLDHFKVINAGKYPFSIDTTYCKGVADSLAIKSFYKTDFDNNGYTDLLASIQETNSLNFVVVMNYPKKEYKMQYLFGGLGNTYSFFKVDSIGNNAVINEYSKQNIDSTSSKHLTKKILLYRSGWFVEYNAQVQPHQITKIKYRATPCFGSCPIFDMVLQNNGRGLMNAEGNNTNEKGEELKGKYTATIKTSQYSEICEWLNYINFTQLKDNYTVMMLHKPSSEFEITYDNGKIKVIKDYGKTGTYGLQRVYKLMEDMRFNQEWEK